MTRARVWLAVAAALFGGWLGWVGYAVSQKGRAAVVSRASLAAATHLLVARVGVGPDGLPAPTVAVEEVVRGDGVSPGAAAEVLNLPAALVPGAAAAPGPGLYLIPAVGDGKTFRVAGMPRSPGHEPAPTPRPAIYPWDDNTKTQLRNLGVIP